MIPRSTESDVVKRSQSAISAVGILRPHVRRYAGSVVSCYLPDAARPVVPVEEEDPLREELVLETDGVVDFGDGVCPNCKGVLTLSGMCMCHVDRGFGIHVSRHPGCRLPHLRPQDLDLPGN